MGYKRPLLSCLGGLASTAATVLCIAAIGHFTGFNLFSFALWLVVPVGAALCGAAALSGFYFVSHRIHLKPGWWMLAPLVALAGLAYVSVYYFEYRWTVLNDGTLVSSAISFSRYLDLTLSSQTVYAGRGGHARAELGGAGYWLAIVDFIGFLLGGAWIYVALATSRACRSCGQYLRKRADRVRYFATTDDASDYYDGLFDHLITSDEFARKASLGTHRSPGTVAVKMITHLLDCEGCHRQLWVDTASAWRGNGWKELPDLERAVVVPPEANVARFVRGGLLPSWLH